MECFARQLVQSTLLRGRGGKVVKTNLGLNNQGLETKRKIFERSGRIMWHYSIYFTGLRSLLRFYPWTLWLHRKTLPSNIHLKCLTSLVLSSIRHHLWLWQCLLDVEPKGLVGGIKSAHLKQSKRTLYFRPSASLWRVIVDSVEVNFKKVGQTCQQYEYSGINPF